VSDGEEDAVGREAEGDDPVFGIGMEWIKDRQSVGIVDDSLCLIKTDAVLEFVGGCFRVIPVEFTVGRVPTCSG